MNKLQEAQSHIGGVTVAAMIRAFQCEFRDVYPYHVLARGVGPEQAFIGHCIAEGFLKLGDITVKESKDAD